MRGNGKGEYLPTYATWGKLEGIRPNETGLKKNLTSEGPQKGKNGVETNNHTPYYGTGLSLSPKDIGGEKSQNRFIAPLKKLQKKKGSKQTKHPLIQSRVECNPGPG